MTNIQISSDLFPSIPDGVEAQWLPILLSPISGSLERLVVGVVASNEAGFHIEIANQLSRLDCFYGPQAEVLRFAIEVTQKHLEEDFSRRGMEAIIQPSAPLASIEFGQPRGGEGESLREIAQSWMASISSLYGDQPKEVDLDISPESERRKSAADRLPALVMSHVMMRNLNLTKNFREDLASGKTARGRGADVLIDYSGDFLVANFSTLQAGKISPAVRSIKTRLWDLKVDRDRELEVNDGDCRNHELIIQLPSKNDPQISERQHGNLASAYAELEDQADEVSLRLRSFPSVEMIGDHVLRAEAA
ncbi:hypothetical protein [Salipiger mangrovisoli]|uniref:Uncharacterized protein n=1 Tax=Salipiger mangrovisoli TaxID=2865933 RepID=A0ABR9XBW6_9RHOB|nr:hypothetical protein [Salipiger mangrovisoli]MBE9640972.1 hypothetical protein [Salipiger mangrovisoli]